MTLYGSIMSGLPCRIARRSITIIIVTMIIIVPMAIGNQSIGVFAGPSYWLLGLLACSLAIPFRAGAVITIQRILATYLMVLAVDLVGGHYWQLTTSVRIAVGLPLTGATGIAALIAPRHKKASDTSAGFAMAVGTTVTLITILLITVGFLVSGWYGFHSAQSIDFLGQLSMVLLAGIAAWRIAGDTAARMVIGLMALAAYFLMAISQ